MCKIRTIQHKAVANFTSFFIRTSKYTRPSTPLVPRFSDIDDQIADLKDILWYLMHSYASLSKSYAFWCILHFFFVRNFSLSLFPPLHDNNVEGLEAGCRMPGQRWSGQGRNPQERADEASISIWQTPGKCCWWRQSWRCTWTWYADKMPQLCLALQ